MVALLLYPIDRGLMLCFAASFKIQQIYSGRRIFVGLGRNIYNVNMPKSGTGEIQKKILLLLWGGLALGLSRSPSRHFRILKSIGKEWKAIEQDSLRRAIRSLCQSRFVMSKNNSDGTVSITLTKMGRGQILTYKVETMVIQKPTQWDGKWRIVIFDIPEHLKNVRDALRYRLKQIGMRELQKSVFIHPYPCDDEVNFLIEFHEVRPYVRLILAESLDNEPHLKAKFRLL